MNDFFEKVVLGVVAGILGIIVVVVIVGIITFPTMWLWNWLMPTIFSLPKIGFYHTLGLLVLSSLLFGRFILKSK